jgi:hypothetical protein
MLRRIVAQHLPATPVQSLKTHRFPLMTMKSLLKKFLCSGLLLAVDVLG